jgi:hypothetical protein
MATFNFDKLKKNRSSSFDKLNKQLEDVSSKGYSNPDEGKYWKPTTDTAGNGYAVIRFLPAPEDEDIPFVRLWSHGFQGPTGQWYIENCLSTLKQDDPVNEMNSDLWNSNMDDKSAERTQARKQKRKLSFVSNVYVVSDAAKPENEGKVFLFKYGKKIFDKLKEAPNPEFEGEKAVDPFDLWGNGANFRLKIRKVEGYPNYDKSDFADLASLFDNDGEYETKLTNVHSLQEVIDPKQFKSYDELKEKLQRVLNLNGNARSKEMSESAEEDEGVDMSRFATSSKEDKPKENVQAKSSFESNATQDKSSYDTNSVEDDEDMEFFKSLAKR